MLTRLVSWADAPYNYTTTVMLYPSVFVHPRQLVHFLAYARGAAQVFAPTLKSKSDDCVVENVAGTGGQGSTDGLALNTSTLSRPTGLAVGGDGDVYFVEFAGSSINGSLLSPPGTHCDAACEHPPCCLDPFAAPDNSGLNGSLNCGCQALDYCKIVILSRFACCPSR